MHSPTPCPRLPNRSRRPGGSRRSDLQANCTGPCPSSRSPALRFFISALPRPVSATGLYNGSWSVLIITETGDTIRRTATALRVEHGQIVYGGEAGVAFTGRVEAWSGDHDGAAPQQHDRGGHLSGSSVRNVEGKSNTAHPVGGRKPSAVRRRTRIVPPQYAGFAAVDPPIRFGSLIAVGAASPPTSPGRRRQRRDGKEITSSTNTQRSWNDPHAASGGRTRRMVSLPLFALDSRPMSFHFAGQPELREFPNGRTEPHCGLGGDRAPPVGCR